jgi:S1-C subfamily serine protease
MNWSSLVFRASRRHLAVACLFSIVLAATSPLRAEQQLPVSAPVLTDAIGKSASNSMKSVVRVICGSSGTSGTGFFHKSGRVITAAHVVAECSAGDIIVVLSTGEELKVSEIASDSIRDLAALKMKSDAKVPPLFVNRLDNVTLGSQVAIWGFPVGYNGLSPLLTVGFIAGVDRVPTKEGLSPPRIVVNAAFNGGNSGGPVISLEDGGVIGVVSSKLAPIPPIIESALEALKSQKSGFTYTAKTADGKEIVLTEGHVIGEVLMYLRSQTQLVIGHAISAADVHSFLKDKKIED